MTTRRALIALGGALALSRTTEAAEDALSAAVLAITHSEPRSFDLLAMRTRSGPISMSSMRGNLLIVNIWASWCVPCRREMPSLSRLASSLDGKKAAILPVSFDRAGLQAVNEFYTEFGIDNLPGIAGEVGNLQDVTGTVALPSTFLIDPMGMRRWSVIGEARWDDADTLHWITSLLPS